MLKKDQGHFKKYSKFSSKLLDGRTLQKISHQTCFECNVKIVLRVSIGYNKFCYSFY